MSHSLSVGSEGVYFPIPYHHPVSIVTPGGDKSIISESIFHRFNRHRLRISSNESEFEELVERRLESCPIFLSFRIYFEILLPKVPRRELKEPHPIFPVDSSILCVYTVSHTETRARHLRIGETRLILYVFRVELHLVFSFSGPEKIIVYEIPIVGFVENYVCLWWEIIHFSEIYEIKVLH